MPHYKELLDCPYLGAYSFFDIKGDIVATIKEIKKEEVVGEFGKKVNKPVCYFVENIKPMVLNSTNMKIITKLYKTPDYKNWKGKKIQIYVDPKVKYKGETTGGIRIREKVVYTDQPCVKCEECDGEIKPRSGMTSQQFAEYTKKNCGKAVCYDCAKRISKANKESTNET